MNSEQISDFFQEYWYFVTLAAGVVIILGNLLKWNWICDPVGKPDSHRYGRGSRRVILFLLGIVLIMISILNLILELN